MSGTNRFLENQFYGSGFLFLEHSFGWCVRYALYMKNTYINLPIRNVADTEVPFAKAERAFTARMTM